MSNKLAISADSLHKIGRRGYLTVDGKHVKMHKGFLTVNGVHRLCYASTFTVTFNSNGGDPVAAQVVEYGSCATNPGAATKAYLTFKEWRLGGANGPAFDFSTPIVDDITLYAAWCVTVTFVSEWNGEPMGETPAPQVISVGGKVKEPTVENPSGFLFKGWLLNGSMFDFNTAVTRNITLDAKWNRVLHVVVPDET